MGTILSMPVFLRYPTHSVDPAHQNLSGKNEKAGNLLYGYNLISSLERCAPLSKYKVLQYSISFEVA